MIQELLSISVTRVLLYCNTELLHSLTLFCASTILPCTSARGGAGEQDLVLHGIWNSPGNAASITGWTLLWICLDQSGWVLPL